GRPGGDRLRRRRRGPRAVRPADPHPRPGRLTPPPTVCDMSVLSRIVESTRHDVARRRREVPLSDLEAQVASRAEQDRPFSEALSGPGVSIIAEHKRRSPSAGAIRDGATVEEIVSAYERGGAAA